MNLVCADVRISDGNRRLEFIDRFKDDPDLQKIFATLFEDLSSTYEIGSLLKVRQPFEQLLKGRKKGAQAKFSLSISGQTELSEKGLAGQTSFSLSPASSSAQTSPVVVPKERTIEEMLEELRLFEKILSYFT
jgi:hypothetical protein